MSGRLLIFDFRGRGHHYIESIEPDGSGLRLLTRAGGSGWENENVALSPDRKRIAFIRGRGIGYPGSAVFVLDLRTGHAQRVTARSGRVGSPRWVLGGRRIVYDRCRRDLSCAIWSICPDGSDARNLTGTLETYHAFVVSPNGRWIAFAASPAVDFARYFDTERLDAERVDGSDRRVLAYGPVSVPDSWSPQGLVLFGGRHTEEAVSLSGHIHRYARALGPVQPLQSTWSPSGTRFAAGEGRSIVVANASGTGIRRVDRGSGRYTYMGTWSPDGTRIAYTESSDALDGPFGPHLRASVVIVNAATGHVDSMIRLRWPAVVLAWTSKPK